jgi:hypothetical protein
MTTNQLPDWTDFAQRGGRSENNEIMSAVRQCLDTLSEVQITEFRNDAIRPQALPQALD